MLQFRTLRSSGAWKQWKQWLPSFRVSASPQGMGTGAPCVRLHAQMYSTEGSSVRHSRRVNVAAAHVVRCAAIRLRLSPLWMLLRLKLLLLLWHMRLKLQMVDRHDAADAG